MVIYVVKIYSNKIFKRGGGLIVDAIFSRSRGPGSSPGRGHRVVFIGKTQ